jgi:HlyD family secretion protein
MKLTAIILALIAAGLAASNYLPDMLKGAEVSTAIPDDGLHTVRKGTLVVTITENGTLVAKESRSVDSELRGSTKIEYLIEEGSQVEEGEVVCRLDSTEQDEQLEQREMDILQASADLDTAQTNLEIQEADNVASIEKAENEVEKATKELERYNEGDAPKARRALVVSISEAETNQTRAKRKHEDSQELLEQTFLTALEAEEDEIAWKRAEVQLESAQKDLELFEKYTLPMTVKERQVSVSDADRALETATKRASSSLRQKEVAVEQYKARLDKLQKQKTELTEEISKMTLTAPSPGIVIYGDPRRPWRSDDIRVGEEIWGHTTIITIPDLRVMQVKLRIHEADISKVTEGLMAKVTMDTYPGLVLDGEVTKIASIASGDNRWDDDPEVKKFDVEVTLNSEDLDVELKPGVSAKAEVFIDERIDVLHVPIQCVFLEEGRHLAYVLGDAGKPEAVEVTPGIANENWLEITAGLSEGDRVLLFNPNLSGSAGSTSVDEGLGSGDGDGDGEAVSPVTTAGIDPTAG